MEELSGREREVLGLVAGGLTNAEVGRRLFISARTVESHVASLLRKLGLGDRRALGAYATARDRVAASPARRVSEPATTLVGRAEELAQLRQALGAQGLVSLVGPGGMGKTRVALRLATQPRAVFSDLTTLPAGADDEVVARAVISALGLAEPGGGSSLDVVVAELGSAPGRVVVLDNCEHVREGAAVVADRLARERCCQLLATSRQRLGVAGERVVVLEPLSVEAAAELFADRAADLAVPGPFDTELVAEVCRRVECTPLLVELAAARLGAFSLADLVIRLDYALELLGGGGASHRHRSARALLGWSYDLLTPFEQAIYRALSVLRGPFRLEAAEAVAPSGAPGAVAAGFARLVEACLVARVGDRYRQLDLVRADAAERLVGVGESGAALGRLVDWALRSAATAGPGEGADLVAAVEAAEQLRHPELARLARLVAEDFERTGRWTAAQELFELAARASGSAAAAWEAAATAWSRFRFDAATRLLLLTAESARAEGDRVLEGQATVGAVEVSTRFAGSVEDGLSSDQVAALVDRAGVLARQGGGDPGLVAGVAMARAWQAYTSWLARFAPSRKSDADVASAAVVIELIDAAVSLAKQAGDPVSGSSALDCRCVTCLGSGDLVGAMAAITARSALLAGLQDGAARASVERRDLLSMGSDVTLRLGDLHSSLSYAMQFRDFERARGEPHDYVQKAVPPLLFLGRWEEVLDHAARLLAVRRIEPIWTAVQLSPVWICAGAVLGYRGDEHGAEEWYSESRLLRSPNAELLRCLRADVELHHGRLDAASRLLADPPAAIDGQWRALYAALRAEAHGGDTLVEAEPMVADDAYSAAIVARARGDLEEAWKWFTAIGASYQAARTALALGGTHRRAALTAYRALGLRSP
jgi:predicted ATPase/DNA-binding CsgD family transcriptional regulator